MGKSVWKFGMAIVALAFVFQIVATPVQSATGGTTLAMIGHATNDGPHDGHGI